MKIEQLQFVAAEPIAKTLKLGDNEYTVHIKRISFGDLERIGNSPAALICHSVIFDDDQKLAAEQVQNLDVQTAAALLALINEVNGPKA